MASPTSSTKSANRRPSELNAAADLVGLIGGAQSKGDDDSSPMPEEEAGNEKKKKGATKTGGKTAEGPITALSVIKDQMADGATDPPAMPPLPPEDSPLKKKSPGGAIGDGNTDADDEMITDEHGEKTSFPLLLHNVISDPSTDDCIHWLSCGTRFMISDKKKFAKDVLPRFYGPAKFTSFTRRLKRWSFARVPSGPFMGAYFNPNFRRGEPELALRVRYNHPSPLSGVGLAMQQQKLAAVKGATMHMMGPMMNMNMAGMSDSERAEMFRQMNGGMNPMMGGMMNMGMMGMNYGMNMGMMGGLNQNMMMMGGGGGMGGGKGYGNEESMNESGNDMSGGGSFQGGAGGAGAGTKPSSFATLMDQQQQQRLAFHNQMGGGGSNQGSIESTTIPPGGGGNSRNGGGANASFSNLLGGQGGGGAQHGMSNIPGGGYGQGGPAIMGQGNLNSLLAQYMTQGGNRGMSQGNQGQGGGMGGKDEEISV